MAYSLVFPGQTVFGENALKSCEGTIKKFGKKALVVTGKNVTKSGSVKVLTDLMDEWGILYEVFNNITGEPTEKMIEAGVTVYQDCKCDYIVGIGGGSPLDSAKAIAAMTVLEGKITDYISKNIEGEFPPLILIPTTAGTGSEATQFSVITDSEKNIKMLLKGKALLPDLAIVDSSFTLTTPPTVTAATGMDALTHAVESYISRKANTMTDMFALRAIKRIFTYLPAAYVNNNDITAKEEMSIAAFEAGVCINNASVTLVHGMSRPIGAMFHVPHGISNAMLIRECLTFVMDGCYERFATMGRTIGAVNADASDEQAAEAFMQELTDLCIKIDIPDLSGYGIQKEKFDLVVEKMASDAMESGSPANSIKNITKEDLLHIYSKLW